MECWMADHRIALLTAKDADAVAEGWKGLNDESVGAPPPGRDVVDYFLFDLRRGYCEYYASAMVVMARSLGIPARVATGYNAGELSGASRLRRIGIAGNREGARDGAVAVASMLVRTSWIAGGSRPAFFRLRRSPAPG